MITLKYFEASDIEQLISWSGDESFLLQWAGLQFKYPLTKEQVEAYLEDANDINTSSKLIYKVVDSATNKSVGHISIGAIDREHRSGRIGKVLLGDPGSRGKGYGEQMLQAVLKVGFEDLKLQRMTLGVFEYNTSALNCYKSVGFMEDKFIPNYIQINDKSLNLIEMRILENEWKRRNVE